MEGWWKGSRKVHWNLWPKQNGNARPRRNRGKNIDGSLVRTLRSVKMLAEGDEHVQSIKVFIKYGKITRKSVEDGIAILQKSDRGEGFWHDTKRVIMTWNSGSDPQLREKEQLSNVKTVSSEFQTRWRSRIYGSMFSIELLLQRREWKGMGQIISELTTTKSERNGKVGI